MFIPKNEKRKFRSIKLANDIKTILVEDSLTDRTIVSVCVKVGSLANTKEYQGLAHFLEHMLFLGSKKYPEENHYEKVISKFGGSSNAYTDHFETIYYFSAFNDGIQLIMDVFSRFFIDPLFNPSSVKREINAINNEHQKNINDDSWRQYQVYKNLSKKDSSYSLFPTGTIETLNKKDLREKMIQFWEKYYSSGNMSICIVSNLSLDEQQKMLNETFGKIIKRKKETYVLSKPIFDNFNNTYQMKPLADIQSLSYYYEIPNTVDFLENKLFEILGDMLINNSRDSFINHLKVKGFINSISTSHSNQEGLFVINFNLTKLGTKNLNYIDGTLKYTLNNIFSFNWQQIINYYANIYEINYNNMGKIEDMQLSNRLSINLTKYSINDVLRGEFLVTKLEANPVAKIKNFFKNNFKILVLPENINNPIIDKYYGTEYCLIKNINSDPIPFNYSLNINNPFLDTKPKLLNNLDVHEEPVLVRDKTWYGGSSKFSESIIHGCFILGNANFYSSEKNYLLSLIGERCLSFYLSQELFNILSLNYMVDIITKVSYNSLIIEYTCPNDPIKFNQFVDMTLELIKSPSINENIIKNKIQNLKEDLQNFINLNPWEYSDYYFSRVSKGNDFLYDKLLQHIDSITVVDVNNFLDNLLENNSIVSFFYGNLQQDQIPNNLILYKNHFNPFVNLPQIKTLNNIDLVHPNKNEKNICVSYYFYIGTFSPLSWLNAFILSLILERMFYNELRTQKQLGYLVKFALSNIGDEYYFLEKIQSDKGGLEICKEIDLFNKNILKYINESNIDELKKSAQNYLLQKDTKINDLYSRYFSEIISRKYLFNRKLIINEQIPNITKDSLIKYAKLFIMENNNKCVFKLHGQ